MDKFVIKHYTDEPHPTLKGNGFDGLVIGDYRDEAQNFIDFVNNLIDFRKSQENKESSKTPTNKQSESLPCCPKCHSKLRVDLTTKDFCYQCNLKF